LFFIRVVEDDDLVIIGWPEDTTVEVTEESPGKLLIPLGIRNETFLIRRQRQIHHWDRLAHTPACRGGARRSLTGTLVAVKILTVLAMVSSHNSAMKTLPWKESESA
jgi:hypothetical protein